MLRQGAIIIASLVFASIVLFTSIFRTAAPQYVFSQPIPSPEATGSVLAGATVDYYLPYPGILPDHFLWPVKAARDKIWLFVLRDPGRKAEVLLLFADKRVGMARELIKGGKPSLGVSTLTKAEKYLQQAFEEEEKAAAKGADTGQFLEKLGKAALKHQEEIEPLVQFAPEDAKPVIIKTLDYPKKVYERTLHRLNEIGRPVPTLPTSTPAPTPTPVPSKKSR